MFANFFLPQYNFVFLSSAKSFFTFSSKMSQIIATSTFLLLAVASYANSQSWSLGSGDVTYQILFSKWLNPDGKTWTGARCDQLGSKCDTRFVCNVEPVTCATVDARGYKPVKSWPGSVPVAQWRVVGQSKYEENSLTDFAYLNLTGIVGRDFCKAILRCQILDVDPLSNDLIDEKIMILKGLQEINLPRYEGDSRFGVPIEAESVSVATPNYTRKGTANMDAIQQHRLEVRVRAWGVDTSLGRRASGGSSTGSVGSLSGVSGSRYPDSSQTHHGHHDHHGHHNHTRHTGHAGFDYATPYQSPSSGRYNSSYPRQPGTGGFGSGAFQNNFTDSYNRNNYGGSSQTYSHVLQNNAAGSRQPDVNKDDMFRRRSNS